MVYSILLADEIAATLVLRMSYLMPNGFIQLLKYIFICPIKVREKAYLPIHIHS